MTATLLLAGLKIGPLSITWRAHWTKRLGLKICWGDWTILRAGSLKPCGLTTLKAELRNEMESYGESLDDLCFCSLAANNMNRQFEHGCYWHTLPAMLMDGFVAKSRRRFYLFDDENGCWHGWVRAFPGSMREEEARRIMQIERETKTCNRC